MQIEQSPDITLRTVPASNGVQWAWRGWRILMAAPLLAHTVVILFFVMMVLLGVIPLLGIVLPALCMPLVYAACVGSLRQVALQYDEKQALKAAGKTTMQKPPETQAEAEAMLKRALGSHPLRAFFYTLTGPAVMRLLVLGVVYVLCMLTIFGATAVIDGGTFFNVMVMGISPSELKPEMAKDLFAPLIFFLLLYVPVSLLFWFSPLLVAWHDQSVIKALFFSLMGCARNIAAFSMFTAVLVGVLFGSTTLIVLMGSLTGALGVVQGLMLPVTLFMVVWFFCCFYASYEQLIVIKTKTVKPDIVKNNVVEDNKEESQND